MGGAIVVVSGNPAQREKWELLLRGALFTPEGDCLFWPWAGVTTSAGTWGRICLPLTRRKMLVSHVVLALSGRPRPPAPNDHALHSCDNPSCFNSKHLRWGSNRENVDDKIERDRMPRGEDRPGALLTSVQVREIRRRLGLGETQKSLAQEFGVVGKTVSAIKTGRTWKHVT